MRLHIVCLVLVAMCYSVVQADAIINNTPKKEVSLSWDPARPLRPGEWCNITLVGYEMFESVRVFMHALGDFKNHRLYQVCGPIGYLPIQLPSFVPGTIVRLKAVGNGPNNSTKTPEERTAYSADDYMYGDRLIVGAYDSYARSRFTRTANATTARSVYINNRPVAVREQTYITIVWEGFPDDDTLICAELRCPFTADASPPRPSRSRYTQILIYHMDPRMQIGCYVTAAECSRLSGVDTSTLVRSKETYALLLALNS